MKFHPTTLMVMVWLICIAIFYILPFQLETRTISLYGLGVLGIFIGVFCIGSLLASKPMKQRPRRYDVMVDWRLADKVLKAAAMIALVSFLWDLQGGNVFDLAGAFLERSDRASALLAGHESASSLAFQIGFVFYPACYIYLVREVAYRPKPDLILAGIFGIAPVLAASLAMGGRAPLAVAIMISAYAYNLRKQIFDHETLKSGKGGAQRRKGKFVRLGPQARLALGIVGGLTMIYFAKVFLARAVVAGGVAAMFGVASSSWGVSFNGPGSGVIFRLLGDQLTYLVFVFIWYAIQGFVMSNILFTDYNGPMQFGTYGIDLASALMRRVNGDFVGDNFYVLLQMNTYGFLPSAFGSLYVDLHFWGLIPCGIWGFLSGLVYRKVKLGRDPRWLMLVPFTTLGIVLSLVNTPLGFANGFVTFAWVLAAFYSTRVRFSTGPRPAPQPGSMPVQT